MDTEIKGNKSRCCIIIVVSGVFRNWCRAEITRYYSGSSHIHSTEQYIFTPMHNTYLSVGFSLCRLLSVAPTSTSSAGHRKSSGCLCVRVAEHIQRRDAQLLRIHTDFITYFKRRPWLDVEPCPTAPDLPHPPPWIRFLSGCSTAVLCAHSNAANYFHISF